MRHPHRPNVFIGSSTEALEIARGIQNGLVDHAKITMWYEGAFTLGRTTIESLARAAEESSFAIVVVTADDKTTRRHQRHVTPRDNVVFECGFFMGTLGRERMIIAREHRRDLVLPSDLDGVTDARFPRRDAMGGVERAALAPMCKEIARHIRRLGHKPGVGRGASRASGRYIRSANVSAILRRVERQLRRPKYERIRKILLAEDTRLHVAPALSGWKMRDLPALLEEAAGEWQSGALTIADAAKRFGRDVLLCDDSTLLWADEPKPKHDKYWRLFKRFASAIRAEVSRPHGSPGRKAQEIVSRQASRSP